MRRSKDLEALASRKVATDEGRTEVSGTAKVGTNEQELDKRLYKLCKVAHHTNAQNVKRKSLCSRFSSDRPKEISLTEGGLRLD